MEILHIRGQTASRNEKIGFRVVTTHINSVEICFSGVTIDIAR